MGKGGKHGTGRRGRGADRGSDESDEDYTVASEEEELIELDDEYVSSFDGDESEESLGEFVDKDEEEEFIEKKVKKVGRAKKVIPGRKRNGVVKPKRKQQVSYQFDECEDSDEYDTGIRTRGTKTGKKKNVSYREPEDDDCDNLEEYDGGRSKGVANSRKKEVSYREQEDEDFDDSDEYGAGKSNRVTNSRQKKKLSYREQDNESCDNSDEYDGGKSNGITNSRKKKKVSYREQEDDDYDNLDGYAAGNGNGVTMSSKKKGVSYKEQDDVNYNVSDEEEEEEEEDDDDEFAPDEIDDDLYDEEVITERKRGKKLSRSWMQERIPRDRKRKRNSKVLGKNMRNKLGRNQGLTSKTRSRNHVEFAEPKTRLEETKLKIAGRAGRRKKSINSDSDFECSGPSDFEYTISEEKREQVKEANEFCRNLANSLRSAIPVKKLQKKQELVHQQIKRPGRKGKEKEEELKTETGKQVCGICLSEEGKRTVRGTLNCCSHYFCFACIVEWSKVESRCPLCKQRFATISKPGRFDLRPVVIPVPERDQVYQPSEEELRGYLDPYEDVLCTECHLAGEDALMLLCDLCDSPAHTYCVGLGHEVPEGNWYCEGCRPTALDFLNPQSLPSPCDRRNNYLPGDPSPITNVRETFDLNEAYLPETPVTQGTGLPSPRISVGDFQAFTVLGRCRIQQQIRQIIHSRMLQDSETNGTVPTVSRNSLFGSQVGRGRVLEPQHAVMPERSITSYNLPFGGQLEGNGTSVLPYAEGFPGRMTHFRGPVVQGQASTSSGGSFGGFMQNDFVGINARGGCGSGPSL